MEYVLAEITGDEQFVQSTTAVEIRDNSFVYTERKTFSFLMHQEYTIASIENFSFQSSSLMWNHDYAWSKRA